MKGLRAIGVGSTPRFTCSDILSATLYAWAADLPRCSVKHRPVTPYRLSLAAVAILLLTACGDKPPVVSADTSCERFAHISFSDAQIKAVAADWTLWESVADQVVAHNIQYDAHCMEVLKEGK